MPKFASTIKSLLANKDKLFELAKVSLNENCSAMLLKKIPKKVKDPEDVQDNTKSSSPTLVSNDSISESDSCKEPIVKSSSPTLTPFGESDFFSEEIENFLKDDSIPMEIENSMFDLEGDILFIEKLLNEDPCQLLSMDLKVAEESKAISPIEESEYSLSIGYEHLITTLATELDENAESSAKNLVPIPSEYEVTSDNESEYNEPIKDDSSSAFTTFTNPLFNDKDDFTSNDNESVHDEDVPIEEFKVYSNPLFNDDEIKSDEIDSHSLMPIRIADEERINREHAKYISLIERLITINPCPCPMENANTIVESLPSSLIPVQDNDSQREENDIVTDTNEFLPPDVEFDFEPNSREEILVVINNNDELECFDPGNEIDIFANVEDDDYFLFMFVIQIFLPYLIYPE
nr:reverse transcriptase domain-containing protein [Tanacetum cinerariifolium]